MKVFLEYQENSVQLKFGESIIGRDYSCTIRFNDPSVSRRHLRFFLSPTSATIEDLKTKNGSLINGQPLKGPQPFENGDRIQLGCRVLRVRVIEEDEDFEEETTLHQEDEHQRPTPPGGSPLIDLPVIGEGPLPTTDHPVLAAQSYRRCSQCRAPMGIDDDVCPKCGYEHPLEGFRSVTQEISREEIERRKETRHNVEIPVLYTSETLSFEALARDLSNGGIFIASELLDPVGTPCQITLLPDGSPPLLIEGEVNHVITAETGEGGNPPGLGISFTQIGEDVQQWITYTLEKLSDIKEDLEN